MKRKRLHSIYMKIMTSHMQLITLTASFKFKWPDSVEELFSVAEPSTEVSSQLISFDCFIDTRSDDQSENVVKIYYQKMIMVALLPLLLCLSCFFVWMIIYKLKGSDQNETRNSRISASIIILLFLVHPSTIQYMLQNFS